MSLLNHDCSANCNYYFDLATLSQKVYAVRDIMPGEELTVGYIEYETASVVADAVS